MNRAVVLAVGLGLAVILSVPASAHADSERANKYKMIPHDTTVVLSSSPAKVISVEIQGSRPLANALVFDSPDGTDSHGQVRFVADPSTAVAGDSASTGKIDRFTEYGLSVSAVGGNAFITWNDS